MSLDRQAVQALKQYWQKKLKGHPRMNELVQRLVEETMREVANSPKASNDD